MDDGCTKRVYFIAIERLTGIAFCKLIAENNLDWQIARTLRRFTVFCVERGVHLQEIQDCKAADPAQKCGLRNYGHCKNKTQVLFTLPSSWWQ